MKTLELLKNVKTIANTKAVKGGVSSGPVVSLTVSLPIVSLTAISLSSTGTK